MSAIGLAVASFIRRVETAPIVANVTLFPCCSSPGVFYPIESEPQWLQTIADLFPLSHFVRAFDACFSPFTTGSGFALRDLAVLAAWGLPERSWPPGVSPPRPRRKLAAAGFGSHDPPTHSLSPCCRR